MLYEQAELLKQIAPLLGDLAMRIAPVRLNVTGNPNVVVQAIWVGRQYVVHPDLHISDRWQVSYGPTGVGMGKPHLSLLEALLYAGAAIGSAYPFEAIESAEHSKELARRPYTQDALDRLKKARQQIRTCMEIHDPVEEFE